MKNFADDFCDLLLDSDLDLGSNGQIIYNTVPFTGRSTANKYISISSKKPIQYGAAGKKFLEQDYKKFRSAYRKIYDNKSFYNDNNKLLEETYFICSGKVFKFLSSEKMAIKFVENMFTKYIETTPDVTIVHEPTLKVNCSNELSSLLPSEYKNQNCDSPFIVMSFEKNEILIFGTKYLGEIKKSVFSYLSYILPESGIFPMHSSVTTDLEGGNTTIFFGLSGTGKTTLSSAPNLKLLGDDEHAWSENGVYNLEAGCYAKVIKLSKEAEPDIWDASNRFGTILENVDFDQFTGEIDFSSEKYSENTRASYPLGFIKNSYKPGTIIDHPKNIIMLTCDLKGVFPAVSKLDYEQAKYFFLNGYTSKMAGTEAGVQKPTSTFSPCFGGPFMAQPLEVYSNLLENNLKKHKPNVWLVNTGWVDGPFGECSRVSINETRKIIKLIVTGEMAYWANLISTDCFALQAPDFFYKNNSEARKNRVALLEKEFEDNYQKIMKVK